MNFHSDQKKISAPLSADSFWYESRARDSNTLSFRGSKNQAGTSFLSRNLFARVAPSPPPLTPGPIVISRTKLLTLKPVRNCQL